MRTMEKVLDYLLKKEGTSLEKVTREATEAAREEKESLRKAKAGCGEEKRGTT